MIDQRFPVSGPVTVDLRLHRADVVITAVEDADAALVVVTSDATKDPDDLSERITVEKAGNTVRLTMPKAGFDGGLFGWGRKNESNLDIQITVPARSSVRGRSATGTMTATGTLGDVDVAAGSVDVDLDRVQGSVRIRHANGRTRVHDVSGSVSVRTGAGDVGIGQAGGSIHLGCASGSLEVGTARDRVRVRSASGSVTIGTAEGDVDITSGSGNVRVGLNPGQVARLDIESGSGQLSTDTPPVSDRPNAARTITVRARTGNGDIHIGTAHPPASAA